MGIVVSTRLIPVHISHKKGVQCASEIRSCVKVEVAVLGFPVPNNPDGFCGRKASLNQ